MAGLLAGMVYRLNKAKLLGIIPGILFAATVEIVHACFVFLFVSPFTEALNIVLATVPQMIIAVSLGMGISIIIINSKKKHTKSKHQISISNHLHQIRTGIKPSIPLTLTIRQVKIIPLNFSKTGF